MGGCIAGCMESSAQGSLVQNRAYEKTVSTKAFSVDVPDVEQGSGESKIRRSVLGATQGPYDEWYKKYYGAEWGSLPEMFKQHCETHGKKIAMGIRPLDKIVNEDVEQADGSKKKLDVTYYKPTVKIDYTTLWQRCVAFSHGLRKLGLAQGDRVGLYEETRAEWMQACYGIWLSGMTGVTVYANLGEDALVYAMKEAELPAILCNGKQVKKLIKLCGASGLPVPKIIFTDALAEDVEASDSIVSFEDVVKSGEGAAPMEYHRNPDELALIMYTSGTTGDPKGVMMTHGNLIAGILGLGTRLDDAIEETRNKDKKADSKDTKDADEMVFVGYLPLAHVMEFVTENIMIARGVMIGYGNPRTLTNTAAKPHGDLQEFKPQFFTGVPRIFDTIMKGVKAKIPKDGVKRQVFDRAVAHRSEALAEGKETPYWNEKVFKPMRDLLGGRMQVIASGAAPLSLQTQKFMEVVFCVSVQQGWGMTETTSCGTLQAPCDPVKEVIGGLLDDVEVKLKDTDVWKHTDEPNPRGEICIRGPVVTKGYYKQEAKTKEAYGSDGWFFTGDVGEFLPNGVLKIIGRTKALAKNLNGEYVALEALESTYVQNPLVVPNGICVMVNPQRAYIGAIMLTDESKAMAFAKGKKLEGSWPDIVKTPEFQKAAQESLAATAKELGRKPFECVKQVRVFAEEWTPENGVLTAASKLKRRVIDEKYADTIQEMFAQE